GRQPAGDDDRPTAGGTDPGAQPAAGASRGGGPRAAEGDGPRGERALRDGAGVRGGPARGDRLSVRLALACLLWAGGLAAQAPRLPEPSRADSLLAQGRLAAAEAALYAASDARPGGPPWPPAWGQAAWRPRRGASPSPAGRTRCWRRVGSRRPRRRCMRRLMRGRAIRRPAARWRRISPRAVASRLRWCCSTKRNASAPTRGA